MHSLDFLQTSLALSKVPTAFQEVNLMLISTMSSDPFSLQWAQASLDDYRFVECFFHSRYSSDTCRIHQVSYVFFKLMKESFCMLSVFLLLFLRSSLLSPSSRLRANLGLVSRMAGSYKEATRKLHGNPGWLAIWWLPPAAGGWSQLRNNTMHTCARRNIDFFRCLYYLI